MFNPCISADVLIEVSNDGEHFSGGQDLTGTYYCINIFA